MFHGSRWTGSPKPSRADIAKPIRRAVISQAATTASEQWFTNVFEYRLSQRSRPLIANIGSNSQPTLEALS